MFSKSGDRNKSGGSEPPPHRTLRAMGGTAVPSLISTDLKVIGNLESEGDLQVDGHIQGNIKGRSVTLGEAAKVKGSVVGETVRISGSVKGRIEGSSVTLAKTAKVKGDVFHKTLAVESGAQMEGQVRRLEESAAASGQAASPAPKTVTASAIAAEPVIPGAPLGEAEDKPAGN